MIIKINGSGRAEFLTGPAFPFLEIDAVILINDIFERYRLRVGHINRLALYQALVIDVIDFFRALFRTGPASNAFIHIYKPRMTQNLDAEIALFSRDIFYFAQG